MKILKQALIALVTPFINAVRRLMDSQCKEVDVRFPYPVFTDDTTQKERQAAFHAVKSRMENIIQHRKDKGWWLIGRAMTEKEVVLTFKTLK